MTTPTWQTTTLGELTGAGAVQTGPFGSQLHASDYVDDGVPVMMPRDLVGMRISTDRIARVSRTKAAALARYRVRTGDVVLARRGEMGRCARVGPSEDGWLCGTGCLRIRPGDRLDGGFLVHFLHCPSTVAWLADQAVGQTLPSVSTRILTRLPLRLPALSEQRRIALGLDHVDDAIRASHEVIRRAKRVKDRTFRQLLTRGPCSGATPGRRFRPQDWRRLPIGSLCALSNGRAFKTAERSRTGLPVIRIQNLNGSREFHRYAGRPAPEWTVETGDLLFAWAGVRGSSFGPCLWTGPRGVLNQHIFRVEPARGVVKEWLFEALKLVTGQIEERAQGFKSNLLHVRKADVTRPLVAVPPIRIQRWIAGQSRSLAAAQAAEQSALDSLIRLKKGLLQELSNGRLPITR